ncbi:nucleoside triphosphate pyrophosphohydrolase [Alteromonas sediminis]|uniref:Nucleoside triphosphate pyrophosphohydrolase n=1 Tax=Alteromonas sediminis TaxID=2259342 RepID=A0A3N5Y030_9ALTE|nr:nucleoside triphosphate pyrophosphohydrolase [Alteromonas sediminis]RPJ65746.1 nucleoside triphosphate pyrophosphohydrolase [Alteromonas sediminis]
MSKEKDNLARLLAIVETLRDPEQGCPWDQKQTFESIVPHTIEEAYEVADAILSGDRTAIKDECGDLLFQVVFYAQLAKEEGAFDFDDIAGAISDKLERRHPHVFGQGGRDTLSDTELTAQWDSIKALENTSRERESVFDTLPTGLPSLKLAYKTQRACAKVGFDWDNPAPVLDKVREEVDEVAVELNAQPFNKQRLEEEIGDAFFALVNLARHCDVDADTALRKANQKFQNRFRQLESMAIEEKLELKDMSLEQMETWWTAIKMQQAD